MDKISIVLLESSSFQEAINFIEDFIENDQLIVCYAHMCIKELLCENIFDKKTSMKYITEIRKFLIDLVPQLNFSLKELKDEYSIFHGNKNLPNPSQDSIYCASSLIQGIKEMESSRNEYGTLILHKCTFFLFIKTLHELAHACLFDACRRFMVNEKDETIKFNTPATHALTAESGNAIERYLCGSIVDATGYMITENNTDIYVVSEIYLLETKPSRVIRNESINLFFKSDIRTVERIPELAGTIITCQSLKKLSAKKKRKFAKSSNRYNDESETSDKDIRLNVHQTELDFICKA
ncbi:unnamed protein product [Rotaria sp. Silwood2]|nr:unnamed protein product [Rotaria sp. Silwood2]CAF3089536.1 unnamed protein product [Rotaria sp. Silwood2]CAF3421334.1 unnamed protein product [Rotaria sp. Silwood2]CAF4414905.1 unnamed protein product [Rotaria sp. Silwood2]CAF4533926.1 unnamed protein product [Rotaria sp. Silwood2]